MAKVTLTFDSTPLPEGWEGTPAQLKQILVDSLVATAEGDFLVGKVGGTRPTTDQGLYIANRALEVWDEDKGKYVTADGIPVGVILPWASNNQTPPANFLFCDGRTLQRTDAEYSQLYEAIGFFWGQDGANGFRLPSTAGRTTVFSGTGTYDLENAERRKVGSMVTRAAGTYFGEEWPIPKYVPLAGTWQNPPIGRAVAGSGANRTYFTSISQPSLVMPAIIKYR